MRTPGPTIDFATRLRHSNFAALRLGAFLAATLVPTFWVLDWFVLPEHAVTTLWLRLGCMAYSLLILWASERWPAWVAGYVDGLAFSLGLTVSGMIAVIAWLDQGYESPYYAGLNLVFIAIGFLFSWSWKRSLWFHGLAYGFYLLPWLVRLIPIEDASLVLAHQFFLVTTLLLAVVSQAYRRRLEQREFEAVLKQQSLLAELQALAARLQAVREEERSHIAREIHDELGGALTSLKMDIFALRKASGQHDHEIASRTEAMYQLIDRTIAQVRQIATELRPSVLDDLGLPAAIEWQLNEFEARSGIASYFTSRVAEGEVDPAQATALFRILQEALTNIARHAGASRVTVWLERQANDLVLRISDNGRGISPQELVGAKSLGIVGMRERVRLLGGELDIQGRHRLGTTVQIRVPLNH